MKTHSLFLAFCLAAAAPVTLTAQGYPIAFDQKTCDKAIKTLQKGHPLKKQDDALRIVSACGAVGATALATAISTLRSESDTSALLPYFYAASLWVDNSIANASLALASDAGATVPARILALGQVIVTLDPHNPHSYASLVTQIHAENGTVCLGSRISDAPALPGTPLASDFRARASATARQLAASATTPPDVRAAARCAVFEFR